MRRVAWSARTRGAMGSVLGALLLFGTAGTVRAALMTNQLFPASVEVVVGTLEQPVQAVLASPADAGVMRDGSGKATQVTFAANLIKVTGVNVPVTDQGAFPIAGLQATVANGLAMFETSAGNLGGPMPLIGVNKVCLFGPCGSVGNIQNLEVPLSVVGQGGTTFVTGAVNLTVVGAPWTEGTVKVSWMTPSGGTATAVTDPEAMTPVPATEMGSVMTTGTTQNMIRLVTPVFVSTNIGASAVVAVFGALNFTVPEPTTFATFSAAIGALVTIGLARRRKR